MRRSGFKIMKSLISFIRPLVHVMFLAITAGVIGFLFAIFITILGGMAVTNILGFPSLFSKKQYLL